MRVERLLRILLLLQVHGQLTASELARRLEVSTRTIQRDLDTLSLAGVPVYANRGRAGGWVLAPDYRTRLNGLTPAEAMTVFVGATGHIHADLGTEAAAASAVTKLLSAIPSHARRDAEYARQRILVDHADWQGAAEASAWIGPLQQGLWEERKVRIEYGSTSTDKQVAPLGLVAKKQSWYLVAARQDRAIRTYKVQRIRHAHLTEEPFERPADFDLETYWRESSEAYFASLRDYPVRLRVRDRVLRRLSWTPNAVVEQVVEGPDGWSEVAMTFEKAYETRVYLLGLAGDVVVLEPAELRDAMVEAARTFVDQHA